MNQSKFFSTACFCAALLCTPSAFAKPPSQADIAEQYSAIAYAVFSDAHSSAQALQQKVEQLIAQPNESNLSAARQAWIAARVPYMQSEVFRFSNPIVDEWEGQLNAWPLDEGLIDYVDDAYQYELGNIGAQVNIIANPSIKIGNTQVSFDPITPELLASLNELGGSEANVASGYHAIEFLLWGQDLNGTNPGAGERPATDYAKGDACTHGNCTRRAQYLSAATQLLLDDLQFMQTAWQPGNKDNYRAQLSKDPKATINKMLFGMGSLSLGELAGERMKVALEASSTEDEQDCFSDNTHYAHYYDAKGISNLYYGQYKRIDGSMIKGASIQAYLQSHQPKLAQQADAAFAATEKALKHMVDIAEAPKDPMKFDQMIAEGNSQGAQIISDAITALVNQTKVLEQIASSLGIEHLNPETANHDF